MTNFARSSLAVLLTTSALALVGCMQNGTGSGNSQQDDIDEYNRVQKELDGQRAVFEKQGGYSLSVADDLLFWVDANAGDNPILHSFDRAANQRVTYGFTIFEPLEMGSHTDKMNFAASRQMIATMNVPDGASLYVTGVENQPMGKVTLPAPPYGQKWWAYAVVGTDLYVAVQKQDESAYTLQRWSQGAKSPVDVLVFDSLIAPNQIQEFINFGIDGDTLIFDDHGRIWVASLAAGMGGKAHWVQNDKEIGSAVFDQTSVFYNENLDVYRYDVASDTRENLSDKIKANSYQLNETYKQAHYPSQGGVSFATTQGKLIYVGNQGLFSYDVAADKVKPLLLEPREGTTIRYIDPVATKDGTVYVTGLESNDATAHELRAQRLFVDERDLLRLADRRQIRDGFDIANEELLREHRAGAETWYLGKCIGHPARRWQRGWLRVGARIKH
jgi:hypothetical protein